MWNDYCYASMRVRSDFTLPELPVWGGDERIPDIVFKRSDRVLNLAGITQYSPVMKLGRDGLVQLAIPTVAEFTIFGGRMVFVRPHDQADASDIRCFLLGTVLGLLCHQRGLFPLKASCILAGESAIAFAGASGTGKSALVAGLVQRGYTLLSDDLSILETETAVRLIPGPQHIRLWQDSLKGLGILAPGLVATRKRQKRYFCEFRVATVTGSVPIKLMLFLQKGSVDRPTISSLSPSDAAMRVIGNVWSLGPAARLGLGRTLSSATQHIVQQVRCLRLTRNMTGSLHADISRIHDMIDA